MFSRFRRRALSALVTLAAALLLCFVLGQLTPGDAFSALELDPSISPAALAHLRAVYEPQQAVLARLATWTWGTLHGNLGYSITSRRPVLSLLRPRAGASIELLSLGLGGAWLVGLALALLPIWLSEHARWRWQRALDSLFHAAAAVLTALPLGILAIGALVWAPVSWLPAGDAPSPWLPALVLALAFLPTVYFQAAHALAAVATRPFLAQGRAAGLAPWRLLLVHALPNASDVLIPVAALTVTQALVELVILEPLLGWPGLGQLSIQAAQTKDMPVLAALVLITTLAVIVSNWMSDAVQLWLNPQWRARSLAAAGSRT